MAVMTRIALINEAKGRAGVDTTNVALTTEYDQVLRDITGRYDLLRANYYTGGITKHNTDNYISCQTDTKAVEVLHVLDESANHDPVKMMNDWEFSSYPLSFGNNSIPTQGRFDARAQSIHLNPFPNTAGVNGTQYLWYTKFHPVASGDTYSHILGEEFDRTIVLGLAAFACEIAKDFDRGQYFRLLYEENLKVVCEVARKRLVRVEYPEM